MSSRSRKRGRKKPARELSAGGVVVRGEQIVVIVPTRRASDGTRVLALPKGHNDPGETARQAAEREGGEGAGGGARRGRGVWAEPVRELGETRYWYRRDGQTIPKTVSFYLFSYVSGDTDDHDEEVEEARWIGMRDAQRKLSHTAEREIVARAVAFLEEDRKDR